MLQTVYFALSSVVSRTFSAHAHVMCVFDVWASSSPLGYPCAKFRFCHAPIAELACGEKSDTQSITHSVTHSPSLFDMPGTEAYRFGITIRKITDK